MAKPNIVILGCGFAGPTLALILKQRGISSTIYEVRPESYTQGGNIALAPNALRVLDHVGLYEQIRTQGFNYSELNFDNSEGVCLGTFLNGSKSLYNYEAVRIHRTIVRDALRDKLKFEGIPIKWEKKYKSLVEKEDKVLVTFEDGEEVLTDFVIGTDGIHSAVRELIAPNTHPSFSGLMGVMGHVDRSELTQEALAGVQLPNFLFGASGSFAIMPSSFDGSEIGYFATIEAEDRDRHGWSKLESDKEELYKMLADRFIENKQTHWNPLVQELVKKTPKDELSSWPFFSVPHLDRWFSSNGRIIVIGDSAHAIPPTGGQGAAMAFEDAETLGYTLTRIFSSNFESGELVKTLSAWQKHRTDRIANVLAFTTKNGTMRKSSPHRYEQVAKEWLIWAMFKWQGEEGGVRWMYNYNAEAVRSVLP